MKVGSITQASTAKTYAHMEEKKKPIIITMSQSNGLSLTYRKIIFYLGFVNSMKNCYNVLVGLTVYGYCVVCHLKFLLLLFC